SSSPSDRPRPCEPSPLGRTSRLRSMPARCSSSTSTIRTIRGRPTAHEAMITDRSFDFLARLLDTPGPSGYEIAAARVWRAEAETFAHRMDADVSGNSIAIINPGGSPRVMLAGHIDEIGLIVTHIDDDGFLYVDGIGGWDSQVLVGQRVRLLSRAAELIGVIGKQPIHLLKGEDREKVTKMTDLWVDVGAATRQEALER